MSGERPTFSWPPYPRRSLTRTPTRPYWSDLRDSTADTAPLAGSMDAADTKTGRFASPASVMRLIPVKFASMLPGCDKSYDASVPTRSNSLLMLVFQSSDARQLLGTSYDGSMSVTAGALSANTPLPPMHWVGTAPGSLANSDQSGVGTAAPTQFR